MADDLESLVRIAMDAGQSWMDALEARPSPPTPAERRLIYALWRLKSEGLGDTEPKAARPIPLSRRRS
jgi:hypothetical protein